MIVLIDSNVLIDIFEADQSWRAWSVAAIERLQLAGAQLLVNPIVVAEIASNFPSHGELLATLDRIDVEVAPLIVEDAFRAGQAFRAARRDRPERDAILADFLIGGHAASLGASILTRDPRLYRRYFPELPLITPDTHP